MNEGKGNNVLLVIIAIATLLVAVIGATFAYFTAVLEGEEKGETIRINAGLIGTEFEGGSAITVDNAWPRDEDWGQKEFTITGITDTTAIIEYKLGLVVTHNSFTPGALTYTLLHKSPALNGTMAPEVEDQADIPSGGTENLGTGSFVGPVDPDDAAHTYILTIYFPNQDFDQWEDQEAQLLAHIKIDDPTLTTTP